MASTNFETTMAAVASGSSLSAPPNVAADFVRPDFHQVQLDVEAYLKNEKGMKLDADAQICRLALLPLGCPLGPLVCPLRHTAPAPSNFQPPPSLPNNPRDREKKTTVCKHYLRNLCKMGDNCVYTHDFNLRTMPECVWFKKLGKCELGGECLYFHPRGMSRRVECPDYNRGFCPSGPDCTRRHIRRIPCGAYMAGFCPDGPHCTLAHPKPTLPPPEAYINPPEPNPAEAGPPPSLPPGYGRWREYRFDPNAPTDGQSGFRPGWRGGYVGPTGGGSGDVGERRGGGGGGGGGFVKDLSTVLCFRCNEHGHFANNCPNDAKPGDRGGLQRRQNRDF